MKIAWVTPLPADRAAPARCCPGVTSSGFLRISMREAIKEGISMIAMIDAVQNQGDGSAVQPSSSEECQRRRHETTPKVIEGSSSATTG